MSNKTDVRLAEFNVVGLFGEFSYNIPLNLPERVTAVIAPNGSGKTVCLRLINALFKRKWSVLNSVDFQSLKYSFSDGRQISIFKALGPDADDDNPASNSPLRIIINDGIQDAAPWIPSLSEVARGRFSTVDRYVPFVTRTGPQRWTHDRSGQQYSFLGLVEAFPERFPASVLSSIHSNEPKPFTELIASVDCHLIETQRLLVINEEDSNSYRAERVSTKFAIQQKADKLKIIISEQLGRYAALSQSLDRSFPKRVITRSSIVPTENLKSQLAELDEKRNRLMEVGILANENDEPVGLPPGQIEDAIARVLSVYVEDNAQKLKSLDTIAARVSLFKELVENRFRSKAVNISRDNGFSIQYHGHDVALEKLSSGEQHQLVLFFELLFELKENALILIDEPELSLHVSWQKRFIGDLERIIKLNAFDVVLATHSPQLIGRWIDLVVELGDVDDR